MLEPFQGCAKGKSLNVTHLDDKGLHIFITEDTILNIKFSVEAFNTLKILFPGMQAPTSTSGLSVLNSTVIPWSKAKSTFELSGFSGKDSEKEQNKPYDHVPVRYLHTYFWSRRKRQFKEVGGERWNTEQAFFLKSRPSLQSYWEGFIQQK